MASKKFKRKAAKTVFTVLIALVLAAVAYFTEPWQYISENKNEIGDKTEASVTDLQVHYIDVGQADSILIRIPTENGVKNMLIDAGTSEGYPASNIENYLEELGITELEYFVITHPHLDHIGAADEVITDFDIQNVIIPECEASTKSWLNVLSAMDAKDLTYIPSEAGKTYTIGEASFTILGPTDATAVNPDDANNYSIVLRLDWGDTSFVFTGDAETSSEEEMLQKFPASDFKCNVLKAGHHGSSTSTGDAFLAACDPDLVVISCGKDNSYGHPHKETIDKLQAANIQILRTDEEGTIILCSDKKEVFRLTSK